MSVQPALNRRRLIVLAIVFSFLVWAGNERRLSMQEHKIVNGIKSGSMATAFCGPFDVIELRPFDSVDPIALQRPQSWWRDLARKLLGARVLSVESEHLESYRPFGQLRRLRRLHLEHVTSNDLTPLAELKHLRVLSLYTASVSDLKPLMGLKNLEYLCILSGSPISDLTPLARLKNLKELQISLNHVTAKQIEKDVEFLRKSLPGCTIRLERFR